MVKIICKPFPARFPFDGTALLQHGFCLGPPQDNTCDHDEEKQQGTGTHDQLPNIGAKQTPVHVFHCTEKRVRITVDFDDLPGIWVCKSGQSFWARFFSFFGHGDGDLNIPAGICIYLYATDFSLSIGTPESIQHSTNRQLHIQLFLHKIPIVVKGMLEFLLKNQDGSCKTSHHDKNTRNKAEVKMNRAEK